MLYEYIVVSIFYWLVAASIAELASAIPSSAGVYQWATVTPGPRWGRVVGFFAGYWNWLAWVFGAASMALIFVRNDLACFSISPLTNFYLVEYHHSDVSKVYYVKSIRQLNDPRYALKHPDFTPQAWHVFVTYIIATWTACAMVCLFNRAMPYLNEIGIFFVLAGFVITIIVVYVIRSSPGLKHANDLAGL